MGDRYADLPDGHLFHVYPLWSCRSVPDEEGPSLTLQTAFTELVGWTVPIKLAPMPGVGTPERIGAVDAAGGMGALGTGRK